MKKEYNNLLKAHDALDRQIKKTEECIDDLKEILSEKILFKDWKLSYYSEDGYVIEDIDGSCSAPLYICIDIIRNVGYLSREDFIDSRI